MIITKDHYNSGLTLIEILVALFLVTLIFTVVVSGSFSSRDKIDETLESIERCIRFSASESILRNSITRIHFLLDKNPTEYAVEYGPDGDFIIPSIKLETLTNGSEKDVEKVQEDINKTNKNFNKVKEFQDDNFVTEFGVRVIGIGLESSEKLQTSFDSSIYVYPSGEKDSAIIILANDEEVVSLEINSFREEFTRTYRTIGEVSETDFEEKQLEIANELFSNWRKDDSK